MAPTAKPYFPAGERRRTPAGRKLHCCVLCGKLETWGPAWSWFGSWREMEDGVPVAKFCSKACKEAAPAVGITEDMRRSACDKEHLPCQTSR